MAKNVLIDIDGVIWQGSKIIKGTKETINFLEKNKYNYLFVTNISRLAKKQLVKEFEKQGMKIKQEKIITPTEATIRHVKSKNKNASCFLVASAETKKLFRKEGLKVIEKEKPVDFVIVFFYEKTNYKMLDTAFRFLLSGAELVANAYVRHAPVGKNGSPVLASGPFVKALEYASGKKAMITGKPSKEFFSQALALLGAKPSETIMVGDSLDSDIIGAKNSGIKAVLVKTGSFNQAELEKSVIKPDAVIESIKELPAFLEENDT